MLQLMLLRLLRQDASITRRRVCGHFTPGPFSETPDQTPSVATARRARSSQRDPLGCPARACRTMGGISSASIRSQATRRVQPRSANRTENPTPKTSIPATGSTARRHRRPACFAEPLNISMGEDPHRYRRKFWESGFIGHMLYLDAHAAGIGATGIGCFEDEPMRNLWWSSGHFQPLYHVAVGKPINDERILTTEPYDKLGSYGQTDNS